MSEVADISIGPTTKYDISKDKENQAREGTDANPRINHMFFFLNDFVSLVINYLPIRAYLFMVSFTRSKSLMGN